MPPSVRDYVLIHELMHLRRMDHSRGYWKLVADAYPDYGRRATVAPRTRTLAAVGRGFRDGAALAFTLRLWRAAGSSSPSSVLPSV